MNIPAIFNAMFVRGILFGAAASFIAIALFWRTLAGMITTPAVIAMRPFFVRFLEGAAIGVGIVAALLWAVGYAIHSHVDQLANQATKR